MKRLLLLGIFLVISSLLVFTTGCPAEPETPSIDSGEGILPEIPSEESPADSEESTTS